MQKILGILAGIWLVCAPLAMAAEGQKVVVELFTSQGCSSCPPADGLLTELAARDDVIALALHVDYWDYIGWADKFADPAYTTRQRSYARAAGKRMIYTPQMIIAGQDDVVGNKKAAVSASIRRHRAATTQVQMQAIRNGNRIEIKAQALENGLGNMSVQIIRYTPHEAVKIGRGENAGRTISYTNIVTSWDVVKKWNSRRPLSLAVRVSGNEPVVVLLQGADHGPIFAAAELK